MFAKVLDKMYDNETNLMLQFLDESRSEMKDTAEEIKEEQEELKEESVKIGSYIWSFM